MISPGGGDLEIASAKAWDSYCCVITSHRHSGSIEFQATVSITDATFSRAALDATDGIHAGSPRPVR
jgi:hypothetical protein